MTSEREAMTLERQAFEKWYDDHIELWGKPREVFWECWQAAIAHLSRAAEPVGYVDAAGGVIWYMDGSFTCQPKRGTEVYVQPPEPARDAKDGVMRFAGKVLSASRDNMADVDGGSIQDWAYECGLLESHHLSDDAPDEDRCDWCDGGECECFRYTELGKRCAAMAKESGE